MGRRITGLFLILRALSPILIILIIGATFAIILGDVRAAVDPPLEVIGDEIKNIRTTVDSLGEDINTVSDNVTALLGELQNFQIPDLIPDIPANISFPSLRFPAVNIPVPTVSVSTSTTNIAGVNITYPSGLNIGTQNYSLTLPDIPSFSVPLPGLGELDDALRTALSPLTDIFDAFNAAFTSIGELNLTLKGVPEHFTTIAEHGEQLLTNIQGVLAGWGSTLLLVTLVLVLLVIIYFGAPLLVDLTRGWNMLRGLPE